MTRKPFFGDLPAVVPGSRVRCRTASGDWVPKVAMSGPRYNHGQAIGRVVWMAVAVAEVDDWEVAGDRAPWVNWPAEDVRPE